MKVLDQGREHAIAVFRVVLGFLFACHGASKLFGLFGSPMVAAGTWPGWFAGVIELVGGIVVALGLGTRVVALLCSGAMAYAYFTSHQADALLPIENKGEPAVLFCWAFLLIAFIGAGKWSLDSTIAGRHTTEQGATEQHSTEPAR